MWDGRSEAQEPLDVPVRPAVRYPLVPRWPLWVGLLPLLGLLAVGGLVVIFSAGTIDVVKAPVVPRTPVLTLPTSAPATLAGTPITVPSPPIAAPAASTPLLPTTVLVPRQADEPPPVTTAPASTSSTTTTRPAAPTPQTREACMDGGWRQLVDDEGRPFANQGQCVRFVELRGQHP